MSTFPLMPILPPRDILRTITLAASASSTAATIVMPAGVRAGDLALLFDAPAGGNSPRVVPAGFTSLYAIATSGGCPTADLPKWTAFYQGLWERGGKGKGQPGPYAKHYDAAIKGLARAAKLIAVMGQAKGDGNGR